MNHSRRSQTSGQHDQKDNRGSAGQEREDNVRHEGGQQKRQQAAVNQGGQGFAQGRGGNPGQQGDRNKHRP